MDNSGINLEPLHLGLRSVKALRSTVLELFKLLGDGATVAFGEKEREKFVNEVQGMLINVRSRMR